MQVTRTLGIQVGEELLPLISSSWLPRGARPSQAELPAVVEVLRESGATPQVPGDPTLRLGTVRLWVPGDPAPALLKGESGSFGVLELARHRARLVLRGESSPAIATDLYSMLTIASALLLGRLGEALIHSAAMVSPDGQGWLLTGDSHSGKSTTCASLISRGWNYLSDDQVVLRREGDGVVAEGLLRPFHLDEGWGGTDPIQRRKTVDSASIGRGKQLASATLGRLLFPAVSPGEPTSLTRIPAADSLARLVRQSPWLLADGAAAAGGLELLRSTARLPSFAVSLGLDTFRDPELLARTLLHS